MLSRPNSLTRYAIPGISSFLFALLALNGPELFAAPVAETGSLCQRGTDQLRQVLVWYVQE